MSLKSSIARQPFLLPGKRPCRSASLTCAGKRQRRSANSTRQPVEEVTSVFESFSIDATTALLGSAGLLTPLLLDVENALAQKGEYGIVEGRIASMTHPILMGFLFGASLYTAWLGFQWRYITSPVQMRLAPGNHEHAIAHKPADNLHVVNVFANASSRSNIASYPFCRTSFEESDVKPT